MRIADEIDDYLDVKSAQWYLAMRIKGHIPAMDHGKLDYFGFDGGTHNGPKCERCGWACCWHCTRMEDIPIGCHV